MAQKEETHKLRQLYEQVRMVTPEQAYRMLWIENMSEEERRFWSAVGDLKQYNPKEYRWNIFDPITTKDSHQLLHVSRIDTGKTVTLPYKHTLIECRIYHLDTGATIAIGQYEDLTIIFKEVSDHGI